VQVCSCLSLEAYVLIEPCIEARRPTRAIVSDAFRRRELPGWSTTLWVRRDSDRAQPAMRRDNHRRIRSDVGTVADVPGVDPTRGSGSKPRAQAGAALPAAGDLRCERPLGMILSECTREAQSCAPFIRRRHCQARSAWAKNAAPSARLRREDSHCGAVAIAPTPRRPRRWRVAAPKN
jgi:hypothetical protein